MKNEQLAINTIRMLGVDAINKANSGHPGIVLGSAPMLYTLFTKHMNIDPKVTDWFDRDRFVLSAGHGSALYYAMLHLSGYDVSIEDLKNFRQKDSKTPGHPEYGHTAGIEITTGPLGQGISSAVGMAIAEKHLAAKFNKPSLPIVNHHTYVLCGDGDLQEGVSLEAASLAGHLKLSKLIVLYDSNDIQLDGPVNFANSENTKMKFEGMNWNYLRVCDGNDIEAISNAISSAKQSDKPTIIEVKTEIGYGCPLSGGSECHGAPLGEENTKQLRENLGYDYAPFEVSKEVYKLFEANVIQRGEDLNTIWNKNLDRYSQLYSEDFELFKKYMYDDFEIDLENLPKYEVGSKEATRKVFGATLDSLSAMLPNIMGGSADLTASTYVKGGNGIFDGDNLLGRNIKFGVREHAMAAIVNGINLHGGLRSFCAGFFVFSDYMKPSMRLAALMNIPSLFIFSHDTVCVGEDGPTHQPIEQLTMLRSIPNFNMIRPGDATETQAAIVYAFNNKTTPVSICTTRQPLLNLESTSACGLSKGAYVVYENKGKLDGIIITCGSELALCIDVAKKLYTQGKNVRVVSMPSMFLFEQQSNEYKEQILPSNIQTRLAVEMGSTMSWYKYSRNAYGINTFGISCSINYMHEHFGFTVDNLVNEFNKIA